MARASGGQDARPQLQHSPLDGNWQWNPRSSDDMYVPDFAPFPSSYPRDRDGRQLATVLTTAIGWLEHPHPYAMGPTPSTVLTTLEHMLSDPWPGTTEFGRHTCSLCLIQCPGLAATNTGELFLPGDGTVYASPRLIDHYVVQHGYQLPAQLCDAILVCPPLRSKAYFTALTRSGGAQFAAFIDYVTQLERAP